MNINAFETLEFKKIKEILQDYALSERAKNKIKELAPSTDQTTIENWLKETTEAREIVNRSSSIPLHSLSGIENVTEKLGKGFMLQPEELECMLYLLKDGTRLKQFMKDKEWAAPAVSSYALSIYELKELQKEIENCIYQGRVQDRATPELWKLRKKIVILEERIKSKLDGILKNSYYRKFIQDNLVSQRGGRFVIPIKSEYKKEIRGKVLDISSSGSTVFVEPEEIGKLQEELNTFIVEEDKEVTRILYNLTSMVEDAEREIKINIELMAHYDFIFAKAKFSKAYDGRTAAINFENRIKIFGGRHPLIGRSSVPLNFYIGEDYRALVITGPNTGGKTVALKTVGLLTLMIQSGMHVPVQEGSEFSIFSNVSADIGDGQSIEQSLSTFSSHIKNIIEIIDSADNHSLIILDEIGAGTDPGEGMGIAVSVLEALYNKGATIVATTHYSEIKEFAENQPGFKNGCMEFDINTLKPLYNLRIGEAGESNAFLIALRLGMRKEIIERAHKITYKEDKSYSGDWKLEKSIPKQVQPAQEVIKRIQKSDEAQKNEVAKRRFNLGDCVFISSMNRTGIVCEEENSRGEVGVMVMKKRYKINQKRLSLYVESKELYPEDYDFDIIFESVENRKKKHIMDKKHVEGMKIEIKN